VDTLLTTEQENARPTVQIGMQTRIKFPNHVRLGVSSAHMLMKLLTNVLVSVLTIIGLINRQEIVYNFVHLDILLITRHQNVYKSVPALIRMQIH